MKKFLVVLSLFVVSISCLSQTPHPTRRFSVQLAAGPAIPIGHFADNSYSSSRHEMSGNAVVGFSADALVKYQLKKSFGISLTIGGSINKQDEAHLRNEIKKSGSDQMRVYVKMDSWKVFKVMSGVFYSIPFSSSSKFELVPMASVGICKTKLPGFVYAYDYPNLSGGVGGATMTKVNLPVTFCYSVSLALNYKLSKRVFLLSDASYFGASAKSKYGYYPTWPVSPIVNPPLNPVENPAENHYSLASLNLHLGAGVRF